MEPQKDVASASVHAVVLPRWMDKLRHMLGADRKEPGSRNFFCVFIGDEDYMETFRQMEEAGLVVRGKTINDGEDQLFHATRKGCEVIGLSEDAIARAFRR